MRSMKRTAQQNEPLALGPAWTLFSGLVIVLVELAGLWVTFALVAVPGLAFVAAREAQERRATRSIERQRDIDDAWAEIVGREKQGLDD